MELQGRASARHKQGRMSGGCTFNDREPYLGW